MSTKTLVIHLFGGWILGLIIDAFGELREQLGKVDEDMGKMCFICGKGKEDFDKQPRGFEIHTLEEHNLANYLYVIPQSTNQSINQPTNQSINQSIKQSINQAINRIFNRSINQSIEWSMDRVIYGYKWGFFPMQVLLDALDQQGSNGIHGSRDLRMGHVSAPMLGFHPHGRVLPSHEFGRSFWVELCLEKKGTAVCLVALQCANYVHVFEWETNVSAY